MLDTGAKQRDAFTVDQLGSLKQYAATAGPARRGAIIAEESTWLKDQHADLVVSDIVPLACAAAAAAGVPCIAVSNFSWDFIYSEYLTAAGSEFRQLVWQIADDYACALRLLRLPGHVPMPAFREVVDVPLVVRHARRSRADVRAALGIDEGTKLVVFIYGGQPPGSNWRLEASHLPHGWHCIVCSGGNRLGNEPPPYNFELAAADAYTPDLIQAADCVLGKIGYGTTSECLAHRTPLVFLRRDFFNEEPFLRKLLEIHDSAVEMKRRDFLSGNWAPYLERAVALHPCYDAPTNGASVVADLLAEAAAEFRTPRQPRRPGSALGNEASAGGGRTRLRDTIAWGYILGRPAQREDAASSSPHSTPGSTSMEVPEWYTTGRLPAEPTGSTSLPTIAITPEGVANIVADGFDVLEGGPPVLGQFPDTLKFLSLLSGLDDRDEDGVHRSSRVSPSESGGGSPGTLEPPHELRAAAGLFNWTEPICVTRAPGRLDVMGGIADYSGATVLQMPIGQAAHVAVQCQPPDRQRLWRHQATRQARGGGDSSARGPALRLVSLNADATNRGPAFDMDLDELLTPEGNPIPYPAARDYFKSDPALAWAAYVAGALIVLMHEKGMRFKDGIAVLVSSDVPEGKGVSSSAAVEVAAMRALAGAHGLELEGRELAILCQKVENLVVGAPCGVMDQMASALGEAGWLLALRCQPAEVEGPVHIPSHIRFWGVDSGIRHSVGGSDYGAVRAGAFMGLKILSIETGAGTTSNGGQCIQLRDDPSHDDAHVIPLLGQGYLANIAPSQFTTCLEAHLPEALTGAEFTAKYGKHLDPVTAIEPEKSYAVRKPTAHPIHENFRVLAFRQALAARGTSRRQQLEVLGELMLQSHGSYSACGLASEGTDRLVALVMKERLMAESAGEMPALYGAKITGGGCGGTVCVVGTADSKGEAALQRVTEQYASETGYEPQVFEGTSEGATKFGVLWVVKRP